MKYDVSFYQIVARLAEVLNNAALSAQYNVDHENEMYEGICGWCGCMAPLNRPAFFKAFGEKTVLAAESEAHKIIAEKAAAYERSHYHAHELEADAHKAEGCPAPEHAGQFVWAVSSCFKGESGYAGELRDLVEYVKPEDLKPCLCCIEKVIRVDVLPMQPEDCDRLISDYELKGGSRSEDVADDFNEYNPTKDELATFYTVAAAVVDKAGRWYLADAEGYDYVRYYYSPLHYADVFAQELAELRRVKADREAEEARREAQEAADRLADYRACCAKWAPFMEAIKPYEDSRTACYRAYEKLDYRARKNSPEAKALRSAETKLNNARRRNILAMAQAAFPGQKFTLRKHDGWGADWSLSWQDGPTVEQFNEATDLDLFATYHDAFDGMEDYAYTVKEEHTDFAREYMGDRAGSIETSREMSEEKRAELVAAVFAAVPAADEGADKWGYHTHDYTDAEAYALRDAFGVPVCDLFPRGDHSRVYPSEIARRVFDRTGYYTAPEAPTPDPTTTRGKKSRESAENGAKEGDTAPAHGLSLVELPGGGVAVVGENWKDTYYHKRVIKAHGCTWNKEAKQWQATDPEAVAAVREWFGQEAGNVGEEGEHVAEDAGEGVADQDAATVGTSQNAAGDAVKAAASVAPCAAPAPAAVAAERPALPEAVKICEVGAAAHVDAATDAAQTYATGTTATGEAAPSPTPSALPDEQGTDADASRYSASAKSPKFDDVDRAIAEEFGYTLEMAREHYEQHYTQFHELKKKHPDALLFFRVGDNYELYGRDAREAAPLLHLACIAPHDISGPNVDALGFSHAFYLLPVRRDQLSNFVSQLCRAGRRIAFCDAVEQ